MAKTRTTQQNRESSSTMSVNQVHADYKSVESTDGVVFSAGNMVVDGAQQVPVEAIHWESSNGITNYTTVKWEHPVTKDKRCSCNCPGWAMKKKGKPRQCKHTKDMMEIKDCKAKKVETVSINNIREAEEHVEKFNGRELRGIMLD